ncbi:GDSL-type esterase/lipase family protein [Paenibacillus montanisoli]|uniref:GDSL family lipase n=1 Tax=Paenibacillus montanisoli TaxID=2081970 RepID=A0A328U6F1_9BACL|nr:GDSL-type esterase/lipase family protein [Paenibacillus montanisoli]RAP78159.1 GDSL family lipase [Paenibacillus montanisoli]
MSRTSSSALWRSIAFSALASTLLLAGGFGYAVKDMLYPSAEAYTGAPVKSVLPEHKELSRAKEINVTAIGDSLTKGTGDATGDGYVKQLVSLLKEKYPAIPVKLNNNLAVNGIRADQLAQRLSTDKGYRYALRQSNLIVFTIGGNDLFQIANGRAAGEATGDISLETVKKGLNQGIDRLDNVFRLLYEINPNAHIVYTGLYNPFYNITDLRDGSLQVQKWNEEAYSLLHQYPNMMMVPSFDLFERSIGSYLSNDHFHPNHEGYAQIAERIAQSLD